ncbi:MAG: hypothetical protein QM499_01200 [Flavobacteriaceae bacterium]
MKYYINKTSKEIIGIENMRELITHPTENSERLGFKGYSYKVIYDMICPNRLLGNGITTFSITHSFLTANYKRTNKKVALTTYPEFKQYRHANLMEESKVLKIDSLKILQAQTF